MRILNFGSLNIDYVYRVDTFVRPGETKSARGMMVNCGGKGLNQSIAAAKAGNTVFHAALIGTDGKMLSQKLFDNGVDLSLCRAADAFSGNAIIQVDDAGQNCILLYGGANRMLTKAYIDEAIEAFGSDGLVLVQNETNLVGYIIARAHEKGLLTALNAAPMDQDVPAYPLHLLDLLIVNEVEGRGIACCETEEEILPRLAERYPGMNVLLTLGARGSVCRWHGETVRVGSYPVRPVDTTAAGDTFTGFFLASLFAGKPVKEALLVASAASALCIQRPGASDSVPSMDEVREAIASGALGRIGGGA